jgi:hypothetical protein
LDIFRCTAWFCTAGLYKVTDTATRSLGLQYAAMYVPAQNKPKQLVAEAVTLQRLAVQNQVAQLKMT